MVAMATGATFEDLGAEPVARLCGAVAHVERERQQRAGVSDGSPCKLGVAEVEEERCPLSVVRVEVECEGTRALERPQRLVDVAAIELGGALVDRCSQRAPCGKSRSAASGLPESGEGAYPCSSSERTLSVSSRARKGFWMNAVPGSRSPRWTTARSE